MKPRVLLTGAVVAFSFVIHGAPLLPVENVGVDGIYLSLERCGEAFHGTLEARLAKLEQPRDKPCEVVPQVHGKSRSIHLNGSPALIEQGDDGPVIRYRIVPEIASTLTNDSFDTAGTLSNPALGDLHPRAYGAFRQSCKYLRS